MELNVGDYVRTKSYGIRKINGFSSTLEEDFIDCNYNETTNVLINKKEIIKSNPNIIDLIEVGDYVNKERVCHIEYDENDNLQYIFTGNNYNYALNEDDIKSVLTHEQFEAMEYKVGDN